MIFRASMYYVALRDWLEVFPRHQVYVQKAEEYYADRKPNLQEIFRFLDLGKCDK